MSNDPTAPVSSTAAAGARRCRCGGLVGVAVLALVAGLLIWAKLQLVASIPRSVIAVPTEPPRKVAAQEAGPR